MYRDNSLMPKEAVRLAVLGTLTQAGSLTLCRSGGRDPAFHQPHRRPIARLDGYFTGIAAL